MEVGRSPNVLNHLLQVSENSSRRQHYIGPQMKDGLVGHKFSCYLCCICLQVKNVPVYCSSNRQLIVVGVISRNFTISAKSLYAYLGIRSYY